MVVVGLGKGSDGVCGKENWDSCKENIRAAVSCEALIPFVCVVCEVV